MATTTTDLIAASRSLDPAGRALLNLWLHRGLDDAAIAHLSGGSAADVAERRRQVVERLAREVGDTPDAVRLALDDLAIRPASGEAPASPPDRRRRRRFEPTKRTPSAAEPAEAGGAAPSAAGAGVVLPGAAEPAEASGVASSTTEAGVVLPGGVAVPGEAEARIAPPDGSEPASSRGLIVPGQEAPAEAPAEIVVPGQTDAAAGPDALVVPGETEPPGATPEDLIVPDRTEPAPTAEEPRKPVPAPPRTVARRSPIPATLGVALGLVIAGTVLASAISGGGGGEERAAPTPTPTATATATPPAAERPQRLTPVPGGPDRVTGTMTVAGEDLRLDVDGLDRPRGSYEVWLYNSLADAQPLGKLSDGRFRLPPEANSFAFLDVSLEGDRNRNHSGRSVLRARLPR